jgi:hypothetical protein
LDPEILSFQILLSEVQEEKSVKEQMELLYEVSPGKELVVGTLVQEIYQNSRDLKDTISLDAFSHRLKISPVAQGAIKRNSRTGKISVILDRRK